MATRDLQHNLKFTHSIPEILRTANATVDGTGVATYPYEGVMFLVHSGVVTDGNWTITFQESDDNSTYTAVVAAELGADTGVLVGAGLNTVLLDTTAADDNAFYKVNYYGDAAFVRASVTSTGSTSGATFGVAVVQSFGRRSPVT